MSRRQLPVSSRGSGTAWIRGPVACIGSSGGFLWLWLQYEGSEKMRSLTFGSSKTGVRTAAVAAVLLFELSQVGASPITSIIAPGDLLPTRDGSQPFVDVSDFQVNDQGQVATVGQLPGPTTAVWLYTPGTGVTLVSQRGDFAPGTAPAMNFTHNDNDTRVKLNDLGQVLIKSEANVPDEPLTRALGYWLWDSAGALHPVYLTGTPATGLPAGK